MKWFHTSAGFLCGLFVAYAFAMSAAAKVGSQRGPVIVSVSQLNALEARVAKLETEQAATNKAASDLADRVTSFKKAYSAHVHRFPNVSGSSAFTLSGPEGATVHFNGLLLTRVESAPLTMTGPQAP
jgi:hypothetical protein